MRKKHAPVVFTDKSGQHQVMMSGGEILPTVIMTRVCDQAGEMPFALIKMFVNLATDEDDARKIISSYHEHSKE